jgi:ribosome-associated protein
LDAELVRRYLAEHGELMFSRSSGPGGQHVNKTSSRVQLAVDTAELDGVTDDEKARLPVRVMVTVQDERSQFANREIAIERLVEKLAKALHRDKPRRKTKPTRASHERRLTAKKIGSTHRQNRKITED